MAIVDIIIPLYNKERTVARTIQSIRAQTVADWRLIVVDDGSTDGSLSVVRQFDDVRIEILQQENRGPGAARNTGLQAATAEYVAFLDADDQWYPHYLETTLAVFEAHEVAFVGAMYEEWPAQQGMAAYWAKHNVTTGVNDAVRIGKPRDILSYWFFFHVGNTVVSRSAALQCGGFYDKEKCLLGEDTVFFGKLIFRHPFAITGPSAVRHNRQDSELSRLQQRPIDIFLQKPAILLDHVLPEKKDLATSVLAYHALRVAHHKARNGFKQDAIWLKERFPGMRRFFFFYRRVCAEIILSRWLPYWVKLKCRVGAPVRLLLRAVFGGTKKVPSSDLSGDNHVN